LRSIVERCLKKNPEDRYESTREMARALRHLKALFWEIIESEIVDTGRAQTSRNWMPPLVLAVIVVVLVAAVLWWQSRDSVEEEGASSTGLTTSIAVLPLRNLGPGEEEYFADGMTEALITHLSKIEALTVISGTSAMRYKGSQKSLPVIARELGVETVLTGSVLHAGGRVRISTQLTEADTDRNLWAESYDAGRSDILALQSEVARAVAGAVEVKVEPEVEVRMTISKTIDPDAHEAYLRGLAAFNEARSGRPNFRVPLRESFGHFERAIEIEPEWAEPYARLAMAYRWFASVGGPDVQAELYPRAKATALRALELDDNLASAHGTLGYVYLLHEWDWVAAERAHRRAVELDPNQSIWGYARLLEHAGRYDEAIEQVGRARASDPASPLPSRQLARVYLCAGRYEEAEAMAGHLIEVFPGSHHGYQLLANSLLSTERYDEAITLIEGSHGEVAEGSPWMAGGFAYALAKDGRVEEARRMLYELEDAGFDWFPELYWVLGEEEKAMAQIEAAFEVHRDVLLTIRCRTEFENFMENPRFREIIDAIGFPN
jgi:TolB-like protein/tetratricopeptide (TPR) repeat protein